MHSPILERIADFEQQYLPHLFSDFAYAFLLPRLIISCSAGLGRTSTYNRLLRLGFYKSDVKKGVYLDEHEREDIVVYR
jgi:protein tyrosine phosphatase